MNFWIRMILLNVSLLLAGALAGCSSSQPLRVETNLVPYTPEQQLIREEAQNARYRLRDGDVLKISFKYERDLDQKTVLVLPDGYISPEGLGRTVKASGRTVDELIQALTSEYAKDYRDPDLSVVILEVALPEVYVLGMVKQPGKYRMPANGSSVISAVASAGGFLPDAKKSDVVLMRATDDGFLLKSIDLDHMEHMGLQDMSVFDLQPYDVIFVPRSSLGDFKYYTDAIFGSALNISRFFWDLYAIANMNQVQSVIR